MSIVITKKCDYCGKLFEGDGFESYEDLDFDACSDDCRAELDYDI